MGRVERRINALGFSFRLVRNVLEYFRFAVCACVFWPEKVSVAKRETETVWTVYGDLARSGGATGLDTL